ncbi:venom serine carboxypeptidase, partial [Eurytemora carolleeae]|uniref:venom serine carboxypeptidase n=1 Tax=Eurytemora carolleeae TaxID=1294199 RepID=UPI000C79540F
MVQPPRHGLTTSYLLEPKCAKKKWLNYVCAVQLHLIKGVLVSSIEAVGPFNKLFQFFTASKPSSSLPPSDVGEPLFLTPLLEAGEWKEAQNLSFVSLPDAPAVASYSGFITVNKEFNSNMFFWYFPSEHEPDTSPLLIWLQGGPGGSSLFGLFTENGPFSVTASGKVKKRKNSWTLTHNVIYIDNPVGTGFSFTKNGYAENETVVADDLFEFLIQMYSLFPNLK